jgi:hypothetical protein
LTLVKGKETAPGASSGGQRPLVLHVSRAASAAGEKATGLLGRITAFQREGRELGHLLPYAEKWNAADMSKATRGMGKDRLPRLTLLATGAQRSILCDCGGPSRSWIARGLTPRIT